MAFFFFFELRVTEPTQYMIELKYGQAFGLLTVDKIEYICIRGTNI